ncbi:MAG: hypothetical protein ACKVOH_06955 [Chlamydiales bacterium]
MQHDELLARIYELKRTIELNEEKHASFLRYNHKAAARTAHQIEEEKIELHQLEKELCTSDDNEIQALQQKSFTQALYEKVEQFDKYITKGIGVVNSKQKITTLLFARHPQAVLAQIIYEAAKEAKIAKKKLLPLEEPYIAILSFLDEFIKEADKSWNKNLYKGKFEELYQKWTKIKGICGISPAYSRLN